MTGTFYGKGWYKTWQRWYISLAVVTLKRSGYGYHNFRHLRARILISFKLTEKTEKSNRPLTFEEEKEIEKQRNLKIV